jgi:hypothetical protein
MTADDRRVHTRTTIDPDLGRVYWVSVDGEHWLPVNRPADESTTVAEIAALFEGDRHFRPMTFARRYVMALPGADR